MLEETQNLQEKIASLPGIRLSRKWNRIYIFKSTIEALGRPHYVQFLIHPVKRIFVVIGSDTKKQNCFPVPSRLFEQADTEFKIDSKLLTQQICKMAEWKPDCTYRVSGTYHQHLAAVVFELREAKQIS